MGIILNDAEDVRDGLVKLLGEEGELNGGTEPSIGRFIERHKRAVWLGVGAAVSKGAHYISDYGEWFAKRMPDSMSDLLPEMPKWSEYFGSSWHGTNIAAAIFTTLAISSLVRDEAGRRLRCLRPRYLREAAAFALLTAYLAYRCGYPGHVPDSTLKEITTSDAPELVANVITAVQYGEHGVDAVARFFDPLVQDLKTGGDYLYMLALSAYMTGRAGRQGVGQLGKSLAEGWRGFKHGVGVHHDRLRKLAYKFRPKST